MQTLHLKGNMHHMTAKLARHTCNNEENSHQEDRKRLYFPTSIHSSQDECNQMTQEAEDQEGDHCTCPVCTNKQESVNVLPPATKGIMSVFWATWYFQHAGQLNSLAWSNQLDSYSYSPRMGSWFIMGYPPPPPPTVGKGSNPKSNTSTFRLLLLMK